jgi:hypothetical protein
MLPVFILALHSKSMVTAVLLQLRAAKAATRHSQEMQLANG